MGENRKEKIEELIGLRHRIRVGEFDQAYRVNNGTAIKVAAS
jgi:hypothetical protein